MIFAALLLFFFFDYVRPTSFYPQLEVLHLNSIVPFIAFIGAMAARKPTEKLPPDAGEPPNDMMVGLFLLLIAVSAIGADVHERVFNVFTAVVGYGGIYWALTQQLTTVSRLKAVIKALLFTHLIIALLNPTMFTDPDGRNYLANGGFIGDGNDFALSVNVIVPLCLFLMSESKSKAPRLFWGFALVVCLACVVLTKSRGGTVALAFMGLYYWTKSERKMVSAIGALAVIATIAVFAPPSYFDRMSQITDSQEGSAQGRIQAWRAGVRMAIDHPLTGVGAGHFPLAYGGKYRVDPNIPAQTAHSVYFLLLGELGFPGVILVITILVWNFRAGSRLLREIDDEPQAGTERRMLVAVNASILAFASGGAFLSAAYYPHWYVIAGLATAARSLVRARSRTGAPSAPVAVPVVPYAISREWHARSNSRSARRLPAARATIAPVK